MFSAGEARCDRWQELAHAAQTLVAQFSSGTSTSETLATAEALLGSLGTLEGRNQVHDFGGGVQRCRAYRCGPRG